MEFCVKAAAFIGELLPILAEQKTGTGSDSQEKPTQSLINQIPGQMKLINPTSKVI